MDDDDDDDDDDDAPLLLSRFRAFAATPKSASFCRSDGGAAAEAAALLRVFVPFFDTVVTVVAESPVARLPRGNMATIEVAVEP